MKAVKFPDLQHTELVAAQWVVKIDNGLTADQQTELTKWLEESPAHGEALVKCASMWDLLDVLSPISKLMPIESLKLDQQDQFSDVEQFESKTIIAKRAAPFGLAATCIAAMMLLSVGLFRFVAPDVAPLETPIASENNTTTLDYVYKTAIGETSKVTLNDGSKLHLNADSEVWVRFSESVRQLELVNGEVFFDVAKDASKPFVVNVGEDQVTAVGTAFNIDTFRGADTQVLVTEGKVKVNRNTDAVDSMDEVYREVFLTPGQSVVIAGDDAPQLKTDQDVDALLSWRDGILVFQGEPLSTVIREISRYSSYQFKIMDDQVANVAVGGLFKAGDTQQLLLVLEQNFGVKSTQLGDEILLHKSL